MRRPAPDAPPCKRPRTDSKVDAARGFSELGRFDYRAAEQLAQGAQGFIVTCGFQRCSGPFLYHAWIHHHLIDAHAELFIMIIMLVFFARSC